MSALRAEGDTGWFTVTDLSQAPLDVLHEALRTARLLVADLELEVQRRARTAPATVPAPEAVIDIREFCARRKYTYGYAVRHWKRLGGHKDLDGRIKFPASSATSSARPVA